jgi:putative lipase involved disintegration of autophagic bodies
MNIFHANKTFSVTGHSLGGGIAQAIAYTFGLNGVSVGIAYSSLLF